MVCKSWNLVSNNYRLPSLVDVGALRLCHARVAYKCYIWLIKYKVNTNRFLQMGEKKKKKSHNINNIFSQALLILNNHLLHFRHIFLDFNLVPRLISPYYRSTDIEVKSEMKCQNNIQRVHFFIKMSALSSFFFSFIQNYMFSELSSAKFISVFGSRDNE